MTSPFAASHLRTSRSSRQLATGRIVWLSTVVVVGCSVNVDGLKNAAWEQDAGGRLPVTGGASGPADVRQNGGVTGTTDAAVQDDGGAGGSPEMGGSGGTVSPTGGAQAYAGSQHGGMGDGGAGGGSTGDGGAGSIRAIGGTNIGPRGAGGVTDAGRVPLDAGSIRDAGTSRTDGRRQTGGAVETGGSSTAKGGTTGSGGASGTGGTSACVLGPFEAPELITGLGLEGYDFWGPGLSADGLTLYFAASNGYIEDDIYVATRTGRGVRFSTAEALAGVNTTGADGSPSVSRDGLTLYFYSTRLGGSGGRDIWMATRDQTQRVFGSAKVLANVNGVEDDNLQWLSADELTMVFSSGRSGASDLYVARRNTRTEDFSHPNSLGGVNGVTTREDRAAISDDGFTIYFTSDRMGGLGDKDIWVGTRTDVRGNFGSFSDLQAVNSAQRDIDVFLSADETELFISSNRSGRFQLYRSLRECQ